MDAALISAAQRVEHYEIAAYGCVHAWAQVLGEKNAASLLEKTLDEEKETDEKLTELAEGINAQANSGSEDDESAGSNESSNEEENIHVSKPRSRTAGA
jgi:ferritin-like metal-binding protein YciE